MIEKYLLKSDMTLLDALRVIDLNKQGFLIIVDVDDCVLGVLTDGDIRRHIITSHSIDLSAVGTIANKDYISLKESDNVGAAIELFKSEKIRFLPVVDSEDRLVNIITKRKLQAALLLDIKFDLMFDFESIDEGLIDYEIFGKPWGFYKTTLLNKRYQSKIISVSPNKRISLQSHNYREEYWIVVHGNGEVQLDDSKKCITCGSSIFIPKGCRHRIVNTNQNENLIITEIQIGDYLGEDDIVRYEDDFGRV